MTIEKIPDALQRFCKNTAYINKKTDSKADEYFQNAKKLFYQQKFTDSYKTLNNALKINPNSEKSLYLLGKILQNQNKITEARETFLKLTKLTPNNSKIYYKIGKLFSSESRLIEAEKSFLQACSLSPNDAKNYIQLGVLYQKRHDAKKAINAFKKAIFLNPRDYKTYYLSGKTYLIKNQNKNALKYFNRSIEINPEYYKSHTGAAKAYKNLKKIDKAILELKNSIRLQPQKASLYRKLGDMYLLHKKQNAEAMKQYLTAQKKEPKDAKIYYALGKAYLKNNNPASKLSALKNFLYSTELKPEPENKSFKELVLLCKNLNPNSSEFYNLDKAHRLGLVDTMYKITQNGRKSSKFKYIYSDAYKILKLLRKDKDIEISRKVKNLLKR